MKSPFDQLLQQPEGKTLEFKRDLSSPRNVLRTLVAFANASGGHLVIGVDEDRPVGPESGLATKIAQYLGTQMTAGKAELAKALGHVSVTGALHRRIRRLLDAGIIEMNTPEKHRVACNATASRMRACTWPM